MKSFTPVEYVPPTPGAQNIFLYLNRLEINNDGIVIIKSMKTECELPEFCHCM